MSLVNDAAQEVTPVNGTVFSKTQDGSGVGLTSQVNGTQRALDTGINVAGVQVDPRSIRALTSADIITLAAAAAISNNPIGSVSLGNSLGKTLVMKTGTLASVAVTADQVILTYTVTAGKTFYLEYFDVACRLTTFAATATLFGAASLESPALTKLYTQTAAGTGVTSIPIGQMLPEPIPIAAGTVIRIVCTPAAVTAMSWFANLGGYEK